MDALDSLSWFPGFRELTRLYRCCQNARLRGSFEKRALATLGITFELDPNSSRQIPQIGPLIVAANHPTGIADGLVLIEAIRQTRCDLRIVANHLLACIPEMRDVCFFVDPFGSKASTTRNIAGLRGAHRWLKGGGSLLLFPAGEVAWRWPNSIRSLEMPADSMWSPTLGRLALTTGAQLIPAFVTGRNSAFFYAAGKIHPGLRTLLLGRELLRQRGTTKSIRFGSSVSFNQASKTGTAEDITVCVRREVDALGTCSLSKAQPTAPATRTAVLAREVASLPIHTKLLTSSNYDVFCADAPFIPNLLNEIGRLREIAFRAAGEGTGQVRDIDRFDASYQHLFVWDRSQSEIVGAYRIGATDRILPESGIDGLYTSTLFKYDERLIEQMTPALELGRSFVRPEYQRRHSALLLLWKGIGELVGRSPRYCKLFGAVSISNRYDIKSQALLRAFLSDRHGSHFAPLVRALNPPPPLVRTQNVPPVWGVDDLEHGIREIETDRGIPVLLRQYLRLNATVLGFNIDRSFGDALDALMMVDLTSVSNVVLRKYLGPENAMAFLDFHSGRDTTPQRAA